MLSNSRIWNNLKQNCAVINGETYLLWMLLKKVKWYKYANINKAIRKPPIMTNMPFEKNKKRFLYILFTESECGKGVCYLLWSRRGLLCLIWHLPSVLKSNTPRFSPKELRGQSLRHEKTPPLPISHRWLLPFKNLHRRCTGLTPTMKGILSLSIISHTQSTVNIYTHQQSSKGWNHICPPNLHEHKNKHDLVSRTTFTYSELVLEVAVGRAES